MKVNIKGLAFVGFAAAIFAASAHADTEQEIATKKKTVTSQYYAEQTYQTKIGGGDNASKLVVAGSTAGVPTYTAVATSKDGITSGATTIPTAGAVADKIADANSNANGRQTASTEDFQVGGASGAWKKIKPDSYIGFANGTGDDTGKALVTINATTDGTLPAGDNNKLPTASAVKTYVGSQINSTIPAGTSGELVTYSGTAGQVGSATLGTGTLTVNQNGNSAGTFNANATDNGTINIVAPSWTAASGTAGYIDNKPGAFTAPTTEAPGTQGFVPAPAMNTGTNVLRANGWDTVDTEVTANSTHLVTSGAVSTAISGAITGANLGQYQAEQIGAAANSGQLLSVDSEGKISMNTAKITSSVTSGSGDVVTSGAVYTYVNGQLVPVPGATCSASTPCALVATGATMSDVAWVQMAQSN